MTETEVYRLSIPRTFLLLALGLQISFSVAAVWMVTAALRGASGAPPLVFALFWSAIVLWNWYSAFRLPYAIRWEPDDRVTFVALSRTVAVPVSSIRSITSAALGSRFVVRHAAGKVELFTTFTGFHRFLSRLQSANPAIELIGL
jgi:FtsH-binding integral membrane protein